MLLRIQRKKVCKICNKPIKGRSDKIFCSAKCKSFYHHSLRTATNKATRRIDEILHRNRSILLELLGMDKNQLTTNRAALDKKKFNFHYFTSITVNVKNKTYYHLYDMSYMTFRDNKVLIVRKRTT